MFAKGKTKAQQTEEQKKNTNLTIAQTRFTVFKKLGKTPIVYVQGVATHKRDLSDNIVYTYESDTFRLKEDEVQVMNKSIADIITKLKLIDEDHIEQASIINKTIKDREALINQANKGDLIDPQTKKPYNVRDLENEVNQLKVLKEYLRDYNDDSSNIWIDKDGMKHVYFDFIKGVLYPMYWNNVKHVIHPDATVKKKHFKSAQEKIEDRLKRKVNGTTFGTWDAILKVGMLVVIVVFAVLSFKMYNLNNEIERLNAENALTYCTNIYAEYTGKMIQSDSDLLEFAKSELQEEFIKNKKGETEPKDKSTLDLTQELVLGDK